MALLPLLPLFFLFPMQIAAEEAHVPNFAFSWLNDSNTFQAGDIATINIKVLGEFHSNGNASFAKAAFKPTITVNGKTGNSSFISGVSLLLGEDTNTWRILFTPIRVGLFNILITDDPFKLLDSSLHFHVLPGEIYPSVCIASWMEPVHEFEAGEKATVLILPRDAFGNNVSTIREELSTYNFTLSTHFENGSVATQPNITYMGWNEFPSIIVEFVAAKAGNLLLLVKGGNQPLNGSPLPFKVNPGPLDVSKCVAQWNFDTNAWQIFSKMEIFITQQDQYGNLVPGLYEFDADVVEKETNLSIPIADLQFKQVELGIQLFSFSLVEPGNFLLTISDLKHNVTIANMPLLYTVFIGYCDPSASIVNGSGLNASIAGEISEFSVYLRDIFQYPSFVEVESIHVQIVGGNNDSYVQPGIYPIIRGGGPPTQRLSYGAISQIEMSPAPSPSIDLSNKSLELPKVLSDAFNVSYTPKESGMYEIYVFCGNVLLNAGGPFIKEVRAGEVNVSVSKVDKFAPKVAKLVENEIVVQLMDSFSNPILSQQSRLKLEMASVNKSGFSSGEFVDNKDGSYSIHYVAKGVGTYEICVSFDGKRFSPCPFGVNVYGVEYFPRAYDDQVSVWEDESIGFDALANDCFAGGSASIFEFSKPARGSLLQNGHFFRYTPYKDYYGNDSFTYIMSDVNGNLASASVIISIINIPPKFISFPNQLQATEDVISPRYGGFRGFEVKYSDPMDNISVALSARSGTVILSPVKKQFWQPIWGKFSVKRGEEEEEDLIIEGSVEVVNLVLQSIQYLGNVNFSGHDVIQVSASNMNGENQLSIPVFVEPVNDPPFINVPKFVQLKSKADESVIFNKATDNFEFSVGDPDILAFPGRDSNFIVTFSVEVDDGFLVTSLPAELINTTELKLMRSNQWQPLQNYVSISKHFMVKANGIRFRGTLHDCNNVMQQLSYHGGENGAILTVKLNDMGHYGCYSDCAEKTTMPLQAEATVNLIRRRPMSLFAAYTFGSAIVIEFMMVFSLGVVLLFFTCRCAILLVDERRSCKVEKSKASIVQNVQTKLQHFDMSAIHSLLTDTQRSTHLSEDTTDFKGCCGNPFLLSGEPSNFRQRSRRFANAGESGRDVASPWKSSSGQHLRTVPSFAPCRAYGRSLLRRSKMRNCSLICCVM